MVIKKYTCEFCGSSKYYYEEEVPIFDCYEEVSIFDCNEIIIENISSNEKCVNGCLNMFENNKTKHAWYKSKINEVSLISKDVAFQYIKLT